MKLLVFPIFILSIILFTSISSLSQEKSISPSLIVTGNYYGETPPLRDIPAMTEKEWQQLAEKARLKMLNPKLRTRSFPFAETALPKGQDPAWQQSMGASREIMAPVMNFNGQDSPFFPPDDNGTVGPNHYMQTVNTVYAIYNKTGALVAGPGNLNTLFTGVTGSSCNDGDPIVLFDEQADRWLVAEFSICGSNDYMLIAVSTTNDPTGTWHKYSFDVADMPDYEKFGIWQDGYYMGTNNSTGNDIYVFERSQMLVGGTAQAVGFNNPWRPTTIDGFMCVPPLDNDGTFAAAGEPGLFITINDDAIGGGSDELWIYELDVDWTTPANSTFLRVQQLSVSAFDSDFGNNWDNIKQLGTSLELDAIPQVVMNPPQYRNFGSYETILCCHTVDVDNTDHAGIRWYELRRVSSSNWTVRQHGTYAPDEHSRWMGSIMLNGQNEIGLGYSVSSLTMYPAIRYCGQSASAYLAASGILDITEESIQAGVTFQSSYNRWGDYSGMQVDPTDDDTFWFTSEYIGAGGARKTKIASFVIGPLASGIWNGSVSTDWNTAANWDGSMLPTYTTNVVIPASAIRWPAFSGDFTVGTTCNNLTFNNSTELVVSGNFTINQGESVNMTSGGLLTIGGNWINNGTFTAGSGTVKFNGNGPSSVSTTINPSDITSYSLSTFTKAMTVLTGATNGPTGDDGISNISIGFTFRYAGVNYTTLRISTNGWVSLNQTGDPGYLNTDLFTANVPNATITGWWDDLIDDGTSTVTYKTTGSAPNRVFTAEWYRVPTYYTTANSRISFQVKLYETTNVIEFHYGTAESGTHHAGESASIGVEDATGGTNHFKEATTGSTTVGVATLISPANWPAVNYRYAPADITQVFNNIIVVKTGGPLNFTVNSEVNGLFTVMSGSSFSVASGKLLTVQGTAVE